MNEIARYAEEWDESSKYFYDKKRYDWMAEKVSAYITIFEIGCGTGYSTLALVEHGHKVITVDKNHECILKAKALIAEKGHAEKVTFLEGDIATKELQKSLKDDFEFDAVICWNVGTYWSKTMIQFYVPYILEYGLTVPQIQEDPESSYAELILWDACRVAAAKNVPVHIIDRGTKEMNFVNDTYYKALGRDFSYSKISYDNLKCDSLSNKGRMLAIKGVANDSEAIKVFLVSVLIQ